jgi:hypothetical protein
MGVRLMNLASGTTVVALARNAESETDVESVDEAVDNVVDAPEGNLSGGQTVVLDDSEDAADAVAEDESGNE